MLDEFAARSSEFCKIFICDGEACNSMLKLAIFGQMDPAQRRRMFDMKFFSRLKHQDIAGLEEVPNLPIKVCFVDEDPVFCLTGPAHAIKNAVGQVCSETKVLHFGRHFCDATGCLEYNMPIPSYTRKDSMSDRLASLFGNPFFLIQSPDPGMAFDSIYWRFF